MAPGPGGRTRAAAPGKEHGRHAGAPRGPGGRDAERAVLPAGRLLHRPLAPGGSRRHHPCPRRPRPGRPSPLPRVGAIGRRAAGAPGRHRGAGGGLGRARGAPGGRRLAPPGRPCPRIGPGAHRACRARVGRLGRLPGRGGPHLRCLRAGALRLLRHRVHVRLADLPLAAPAGGVRPDRCLVARQCRGGAAEPADGLQLRQGATPPGGCGGEHRPDRRARGRRADQPRLPRGGHRLAAHAQRRAGAGQGRAATRAGDRAAERAGQRLEPPVPGGQRRVRQRVDAAAWRPPAPGRGPGLRVVGSCGLARPARSHCRDRCPARDRDARLRGGDGALAATAGPGGGGLSHRVRRRAVRRRGGAVEPQGDAAARPVGAAGTGPQAEEE